MNEANNYAQYFRFKYQHDQLLTSSEGYAKQKLM